MTGFAEGNRAGWNLIAPRRDGIAVERFRAGEVTLADFERELAGDVTGRRVVQLACSYGDLTAFARMVAARLRPGGAVLLCDHHPAWEVLAVREPGRLAVAGDYFGRGRPNRQQDDAKRPEGARGQAGAPELSMFVWPVSDVVMALTGAGLRLDAFREAPEPALYAGLGDTAGALPAYYVIKASKH
ncbi:hypothetical protein [Actinoplanes sp. NPDC048796]|uniref:hypothetical protein n=1 Tax=Actinoplanes sp. NPDC048796 TaxID=3155640 RepID=UPI0033CDC5C2